MGHKQGTGFEGTLDENGDLLTVGVLLDEAVVVPQGRGRRPIGHTGALPLRGRQRALCSLVQKPHRYSSLATIGFRTFWYCHNAKEGTVSQTRTCPDLAK